MKPSPPITTGTTKFRGHIRGLNPVKARSDDVTHVEISVKDLEALIEEKENLEARANLFELRSGFSVGIPGTITRATVNGTHPLEAWRRYVEMTQGDLVNKAGKPVTQGAISDIETGKAIGKPMVLKRLADALEIPMDYLLAD